MTFNYYYGSQADQFSFIRIPKTLLVEEKFATLSLYSKVLYGVLLDRMSLSMQNGWFDEQNRVYIIYQIEEIQRDLHFSKKKSMDLLGELETFGLLEKKRRGHCLPNILYVKSFMNEIDESSVRYAATGQGIKSNRKKNSRNGPLTDHTVTGETFQKDPDHERAGSVERVTSGTGAQRTSGVKNDNFEQGWSSVDESGINDPGAEPDAGDKAVSHPAVIPEVTIPAPQDTVDLAKETADPDTQDPADLKDPEVSVSALQNSAVSESLPSLDPEHRRRSVPVSQEVSISELHEVPV